MLQDLGHHFTFSRRMTSEFCNQLTPKFLRGRREGRVSADTHGPRAAKKHAAEPQVQPGQPAFPAQWCYGLYVLSPVRPGFVVTVPCDAGNVVTSATMRQRIARGTCIGAPGPHDFAVRDMSFVS